jgi:hypothetical protein
MRIARGLEVLEIPSGVRVIARDWPSAAPVAALAALTGVPLLGWSLATSHWIEAGGAAVFCAFAAFCARLSMAHRRDLSLLASPAGVDVRGSEGCGVFRRPVESTFAAPARVDIVEFPVEPGAPDLPDRGGDLLLAAADRTMHLARRTGPSWRTDLEAARAQVLRGISSIEG